MKGNEMTFVFLEKTVERETTAIEDELDLLDGYMTDLDYTSQLIDDTWTKIDDVLEQIKNIQKEFIGNKQKIETAIKDLRNQI
tara:strand:- start:523 stop:771 length:249 start_codon:yes stop_codon:yes gene_type:complete